MEKETNVQIDVNEEIPKVIMLGDSKYLHSSDEEFDYLVGEPENGVSVTLKFTKDEKKNEEALEGLKIFFSWL